MRRLDVVRMGKNVSVGYLSGAPMGMGTSIPRQQFETLLAKVHALTLYGRLWKTEDPLPSTISPLLDLSYRCVKVENGMASARYGGETGRRVCKSAVRSALAR